MSETTTETTTDEVRLGPSEEQLAAEGEPQPLPEDLAKAVKGEQVEFTNTVDFVFEGGTPETPSCFDEVNAELGKGRAKKEEETQEADAEKPRRPRWGE